MAWCIRKITSLNLQVKILKKKKKNLRFYMLDVIVIVKTKTVIKKPK